MRSTRKQPFCWQEKKILRILRAKYKKSELVKLRCLYGAITEMDSDFNSKDIKYYTKTISTYSGLSLEWIPKGLKKFEDLGMIKIIENRENGKFKGKELIFTPENVKEVPRKTVPGKTVNGKPFAGKTEPSEDSSSLEDSFLNEDSIDNTNGHSRKTEYTQEFLDWFNSYPKQKDTTKAEAFKWWQRKTKSEKDSIILATKTYSSIIQKERTKNQFIIAARNFIGRDERYLNYLEIDEPEEKRYISIDKLYEMKRYFKYIENKYFDEIKESNQREDGEAWIPTVYSFIKKDVRENGVNWEIVDGMM